LRQADHFLIILFRGAELRREFLRGQIMMVIRAGGVIQLLKQAGERRLVSQRQADGQIKIGGRRQKSFWLQPRQRRRHMTVQRNHAWRRDAGENRGAHKGQANANFQ